jgi:hypothetical protein
MVPQNCGESWTAVGRLGTFRGVQIPPGLVDGFRLRPGKSFFWYLCPGRS